MRHILLGFRVWLIALCLTPPIFAANKPKPNTGNEVLHEVLNAETDAANTVVDRRDALKVEMRTKSDRASVWWQAGYIQVGNQWLPCEDSMAIGNAAAQLDAYDEQRSQLREQPHGQWRLAKWCRKNKLADQERVHLQQLLKQPDSTIYTETVLEHLGYQRSGSTWISPQERKDGAHLTAEIEESHKRWDARLHFLAQQLAGTPKQQAIAIKALEEITEVSIVHAIVDDFSLASRVLAESCVKTLGQIHEYQAARALAGQALFSPWQGVRTVAMDRLKQRDQTHYVPDLLMLLSNPIRTRTNVTGRVNPLLGETTTTGPNFFVNLDYVWVEETQDTIRIGIRRLFPVSFAANTVHIDSVRFPDIRGSFDRVTGQRVGEVDSGRALMELAFQAETLDYTAETLNDGRVEMNRRVGRVLAHCTDQEISYEPKVWWDYWTNFASVATPQISVVVVDERKSQPNVPSFSQVSIRRSCLVAGTPVWTERGQVSIEKIQAGDRVLAKDVKSGELCYKPVLFTTVREPTPVQTFDVDGESIGASYGHHFWISGHGWTKLRELAVNDPVHTVTGMHRIQRIEDEGKSEKVYNLVVADFHTYFVGNSMVLSHDVMSPGLTNVKVPGLAAQ